MEGSGLTATRGTVYTIGHSTRTLESFAELLRMHDIALLADIRTIPRSSHNPQYNIDTLPSELNHAGVKYTHMPGLGGRRRPSPDSPNMGWRNSSFRGYADYMQTPEFQKSLDELIQQALVDRTAIMCAEAVPWRCHRSLVSDALLVNGFAVNDIIGPTSCRPHVLTRWAHVNGSSITYPSIGGDLEFK